MIVLNTDYSPIKDANFQVNPVVVDLEEEMILKSTTNGAITPKEAFDQVLERSLYWFTYISKLIK